MRHHPRKATEVVRILATNWQIVLIGMMLTAMTTTTFYLITAGRKATPALWLSTAAIIGLIGTSLSSRTERAKSKVALA